MTDAAFSPVVLWEGAPVLLRHPEVFDPGTDSVLLADFCDGGKRIADLGCGGGILSILLAARSPDAEITAIDLSPAACATTLAAAERNGFSHRIRVLQGDLRQPETLPEGGSFDCAVCNPPYFAEGRGTDAAGARLGARGDGTCGIEDVCRAARRLVRWGGRFFVVWRPERLAELFRAAGDCRLEPKRLRFARHCPGADACAALVEFRHGGKPGLTVLPEFVFFSAEGAPAPEYRALYHREGDV